MNRFLFACASLAFFGCPGPGNEVILEDFQGGAFIIIEMPAAGVSDTSISELSVGVLTLEGNRLKEFNFGANELKGLENGAWPTTRGTCVPLRSGIENPPATFLPNDSSCITFALVHDFNKENQLDQELIITLDIKAKNGSQAIKAQLAHTIRIERGIFKGDPAIADETSDLQPSIATLDIVVPP